MGKGGSRTPQADLGLEHLDWKVAHACAVGRVEQKVEGIFNDGCNLAMHIDIAWQHVADGHTLETYLLRSQKAVLPRRKI